MTHKVHPKIFRIKKITDWNSRGFYQKKFSEHLKEDFKIREFLRKKLGKIGVDRIEIERFPTKINIIISTARPGLIIGRRGGGIEELKNELEKKLSKKLLPKGKKTPSRKLRLEIREIKDPWLSASLSAQWIAQQIEKRVSYRRVLKRALDRIMSHKEVQGARVEVAGRLNGVMIARTEWLKKGKLPRQTLRADIDYGVARAYCTYGVVGVKVWIYKGEKF
ncbi:30S ribosomal protein S3 [Patescibacteria group bacterium]|nr:30S ribosomal protein S3 [Patescibacteria group bacterium]